MSGTIWTKFYWADWESDPALRLCSYGAQGLWMRMLCIAAAHDPIGYVAVAGRGLNETSIARMTGGSESEVRDLLGELDQNGVFSRDRQGRIYSRRMVSDAKRAAIAKKNGKQGGNPTLSKDRENPASDNPSDNTPLKTQEPTTNNQKEEPCSPLKGTPPEKPKAEVGPSLKVWVDRIWEISPSRARERSGRPLLDRALRAAVGRGKDPAIIVPALEAYFASPDARKNDGEFVKGVHRMIEGDRWEAFVAEGSTDPPDTDPWPRRLREFQSNQYWNTTDWGPKPGKPGCRAPQAQAQMQAA